MHGVEIILENNDDDTDAYFQTCEPFHKKKTSN